ncbi:MAG TPA: ATP-binding protein [Steroidobacteraceae bacterium]|nr:ATP-binding protein [Steroidobacteraceae bacterium]
MPLSTEAKTAPEADLFGRIVGLTNLYRLLAAMALLAVHYLTRPAPVFGSERPQLFIGTCVLWLVMGLLLSVAGRQAWSSRRSLVLTHTLIDTAAISVLLYASGGANSVLGILLVIPVGSMALLAERRDPPLIAAIAALGMLLQQLAAQLADMANGADYTQAGIMGVVVFVVALTAWPVATRLRESEALVRRQEVDLANAAQLSQYIVQHLRESILVVDPGDRVRLINDSAAQMLGEVAAVSGALLGETSPRLLYLLASWRQYRTALAGESGTFVAHDGARVIRPHFAPLGDAEPAPVIVFLEDTGVLAERIQQSKLAALGRLSASIAHEIRNPVGAMSHAAQLLAEAPGLDEENRRLTEIMRNNAGRVSQIIDNVLQLSRREPPRPERLNLAAWCGQFREEFCGTHQLALTQLPIHVEDEVEVRVDPTQLHQVLWNLCQNAHAHGQSSDGRVELELRLGRLAGSRRPYLEVADRGMGIDPADSERIFEPFFTRKARGTGLGLFLARELAQSNGATLLHEARGGGGSLFRVVFSDPARWER